MALFVFGIIFLLIAIGGLIAAIMLTGEDRIVGVVVFFLTGIIGGLLFIFSFYNSVPARAVGIPITFGKIGKPVGSGVHWAAPWVSYTTCPLTEETDIQNADPNSGSNPYDQAVRIAGSDQGGALADVTVQYHINPNDAQAVYAKFKCNLNSVKDYLMVQRVRSDVATAAAQYLSVDLKTNRAQMEQVARSALQSDLQPFGITVDDLVISTIVLDPNVQNAANAKLAAQQNALTQQFNLEAAQKQAQINATKQQSLTEAILCEQTIQAVAAAKPQIINSWGACGGGSASSSTGVIVNGH